MDKENITNEEFTAYFKQEVLASMREYEANPHNVYTLEEVKISMRQLFAEVQAKEQRAA